MGCNISNEVAVTQLSSEELQNNQEAKSQILTSPQQTLLIKRCPSTSVQRYITKNDSIGGTEPVPTQDGAAWPTGISKDRARLEDQTSEGDYPEELPERFTSSWKSSNAQSTVHSLSWSPSPPSIIKKKKKKKRAESNQKSTNTTSKYTLLKAFNISAERCLEKTLKKPPARLEKKSFGNKEVGDSTMKDMQILLKAK
ncbi:LOW QUALITY PROTEIN: uncharacterized protein PRD47_002050 [Ara ararauna]